MDNKVKGKIREGVWCSVFGAAWVKGGSLSLSDEVRASYAKSQADEAVKWAKNPEYTSEHGYL